MIKLKTYEEMCSWTEGKGKTCLSSCLEDIRVGQVGPLIISLTCSWTEEKGNKYLRSCLEDIRLGQVDPLVISLPWLLQMVY